MGRRHRQETREFATFTGRLVELRDWLVAEDVTQVAMDATGVYWRPVWHVLEEAASLELLFVNPAHFKNLPGRKTDVKDSEWLAQLLECGPLRGSFIPPANIAKLRDLTRYRTKIIGERVGRPNGSRSCSKTRASSWTPSPPTCCACRAGGCWRPSSPERDPSYSPRWP